ncbi:MAG: hypothetical protein IJX63_01045 [Lachnospiraceae bacterium]|nr:hypothetical protein [Lachnospiraceae bacterium]
MENKIPTMKLIFGSVGASLVLVIAALLFTIIGSIPGMVIFAIAVLYGVEKLRKYFIEKYNISMMRLFLLTMLPPIVPFGLFAVYYVYMDNNYWAELEGLFAYIILLAWAGVLVVAIGGTLGIAWIRKIEAMK